MIETESYPTPPHGPGWVGEDNCWHHGYEPVPDDAYIVCCECGHCYATPDELRAAYRRIQDELEADSARRGYAPADPLIVPPATKIFFCQECTHDF